MNVYETRMRLGLSQQSLGQLIGYTSRQVQRWEAGVGKVPLFVQMQITRLKSGGATKV